MFRFKRFTIKQDLCAMKVGMDGVLLGSWAQGGKQILDIGTGTGLIALMMAQRYPEAKITTIDIDEGAIKQAIINVNNSPYKEQISVKQEAVQIHKGLYDAIVSNPPYFINSLRVPEQQRNIARHTDTLSYEELMQAASRMLTNDGEFSVIVPFDYKKRMEDEAVFSGLFPHHIIGVRTIERKPPKRYLLSFRKYPIEKKEHIITIGDESYHELTNDFYL